MDSFFFKSKEERKKKLIEIVKEINARGILFNNKIIVHVYRICK